MNKQAHLQQALDVARQETADEKERSTKARMELEREGRAMLEEITELRDNLRQSRERLKHMEGKHKVATDRVRK